MEDKKVRGERTDAQGELSDGGLAEFELEWKNTVLQDKIMETKVTLEAALADQDWAGPSLRMVAEALVEDLGLFLIAIGRWGKGR
jgi:hypothetical protein